MKVKNWQIAVIVLGLIVGGGSAAWTLFRADNVNVNMVFHCVDVETGDIYTIDGDKYPTILPARHPKTSKISLVRVTKDDGGKWHVSGRDLQTLDHLDDDVKNIAVDPASGDLKLPTKEPIAYVRN